MDVTPGNKKLSSMRNAEKAMITPKYVTVRGTMEVNWTVELPVEHCRESVACDDPAVEAAMQGVHQSIGTFLWGSDKPAAVVFCEVDEAEVTVEDDDRLEEAES